MAQKYNFKTLAAVPGSNDFVDVILSKTQRKTPTVIHPGYKISRIRGFYMRKVKYTAQNFHDRLTKVLEDFPRLEDMHPFYSDLINVLYSKDHYKLALASLNRVRTLIDNIGKDYVKLLKFGDSLYRCKELKRAALGRMCTALKDKQISASLGYLEEVRKHLSRLPSIDPNTRTLMITGYPNVGKSSFINKVTKANVEVAPYPFTTKSLFVGHFDYKYMKWQAIDTPGILDHPLEDRNTIEMQAITALAHLQSTVLFFIDISEQCGWSIKQQVGLFHSIKPLFANKPLLIVANKIDVRKPEQLSQEDQQLIQSCTKDKMCKIIPMSNHSEDGIANVVTSACDMLLTHRVEKKLSSKRVDDIRNRIHVAQPVARDDKPRPSSIPQSVQDQRSGAVPKQARKTEKQIELENGGPGIYTFDSRKEWNLDNDEWKYDVVPEIIDGKNIADFIDPEIDKRLAELEEQEEAELAQASMNPDSDDESGLDDEKLEMVDKIRKERKIIIAKRRLMKTNNKPTLPRKIKSASLTMDSIESELGRRGVDTSKLRERSRTRGRKRDREQAGLPQGQSNMDTDGDDTKRSGSARRRGSVDGNAMDDAKDLDLKDKLRSLSRPRSRSKTKEPQEEGLKNKKQKVAVEKLKKAAQKPFNLDSRKGEGDRRFLQSRPKHLFSGKRNGQHTAWHR